MGGAQNQLGHRGFLWEELGEVGVRWLVLRKHDGLVAGKIALLRVGAGLLAVLECCTDGLVEAAFES